MAKESIQCFYEDISRTIQRQRMENDLTFAEMIGCLEMIKHDILNESLQEEVDEVRGF